LRTRSIATIVEARASTRARRRRTHCHRVVDDDDDGGVDAAVVADVAIIVRRWSLGACARSSRG
jgi:hypothetical protein